MFKPKGKRFQALKCLLCGLLGTEDLRAASIWQIDSVMLSNPDASVDVTGPFMSLIFCFYSLYDSHRIKKQNKKEYQSRA